MIRGFRSALVGVIALLTIVLLQPGATGATTAAAANSTAGGANLSNARVAADVLMDSYDPVKAWWPSSWWNSAVAMQTIEDYMQRTGDRRYVSEVDNTFEKDKGVFPPGVLSGDPLLGDFTSRAIDDTEWWGLTWLAAYDLTGNRKYLNEAVIIADYVQDYWDPGTCGGGVWWNAEKTYKNSVTNGLYVRLTAELHNRIHGDRTWLARSQTAWKWFTGSGLINSDGLVNDGLTDTCQNNGQTVWSYNQGLAIGAGLELWRANHDPKILGTVRHLADAAITAPELVTDGVLTESCDTLDRTCDDNGKQFKGVFMRYMMDAADTTHDPRYRAFLDKQASSIWTNDRGAGDRLGERWSGADNADFPNARDWRTQASALSALIAVIPRPAPARSLSASMSPAEAVLMPSETSSVQQNVDLQITATAPRHSRVAVDVEAHAPAGWSVRPKRSALTLRPNGNAIPAMGTVPLTVTVPSGAQDGIHRVDVTVRAPHNAPFHTAAAITVAHDIDFDTGTDGEQPWLWDADGSQSSGAENRFADGEHYFIYRFPLPADTTAGQVTLSIDNEFLVQASSDGQNWTTVLTESRQIHDGENKADRSIDITPFLGTGKTVYIRVADSFPDDGWGGRVSHVTGTID